MTAHTSGPEAAVVIIGSAFTGSFRRFERIGVAFCGGSLLLIPVYFLAHPRVPRGLSLLVMRG